MSSKYFVIELGGATRTVRIAPNALASGGDGAIHLIEGEPALVAKLYHQPGKDPTRLDKVRAMLADPPQLPPIEVNGFRYIQMAWPLGWLENMQGAFAGYVMPLVDLSRATALENLLAKKTRRLAGLPESYGYRLNAAANLSALVAELHSHRHHIIDLKPINLNVYTDTFYMALLDCDGLSVHGANGERFPAHQYSDGYICPEALQQPMPPQALGEEQDRFALAVILFQLLNRGLHPYQGVPAKGRAVPPTNGERIQKELYAYGRTPHPALAPSPWSIHDFFDDETRLLFDRAFTSRYDRPSAREWRQHLQPYTEKASGKLLPCPANPEHVRFEKGCPWCELENRQQQISGRPRKTQPRPNHHPNRSPVYKPRPGRRTAAAAPPSKSTAATTSSTGQSPARSGLSPSPLLFVAGIVILLISVTAGVYYLGQASNNSRKLREELWHESWDLRHPKIEMQKDLSRIGTDTWKDAISIVPLSPSSGHWEIEAMTVKEINGKSVKGSISGLKFTAEDPLKEGRQYIVEAELRYISISGDPVTFEKVWVRSWYSARPTLTQELQTHVLSPIKTFTQADLNLESGIQGIGSELKFSMDGKYAFVGATERNRSPEPDGRILVLEKGDNNSWNYIDMLKPEPPPLVWGDMENRLFRFGQNIQVSRNGDTVAALSCDSKNTCRLHFFTQDGRDWEPEGELTVNPSLEKGFFPEDFALAPAGDLLAVLVREGIRIYRPDTRGNWQLSQNLPKPQLENGQYQIENDHHLSGDLQFSINGRHLFIGAPKISRNISQQGAILVYSAGQDNRFPQQPNYVFPDLTNSQVGWELALSGNGKIMAVSADGAKETQIHIYKVNNGELTPLQIIKRPTQFEQKTQGVNFARGFSLSQDGSRLLTGPSPYSQKGLPLSGIQLILYERKGDGEYKPTKRFILKGFEMRLYRPPDYLRVAISPDGRSLIMGNSGKYNMDRNDYNVDPNDLESMFHFTEGSINVYSITP